MKPDSILPLDLTDENKDIRKEGFTAVAVWETDSRLGTLDVSSDMLKLYRIDAGIVKPTGKPFTFVLKRVGPNVLGDGDILRLTDWDRDGYVHWDIGPPMMPDWEKLIIFSGTTPIMWRASVPVKAHLSWYGPVPKRKAQAVKAVHR